MADAAEATFAGAGGLEIFRQRWEPEGAQRGALVIAHGAGEHSGRYREVAGRLTGLGLAVHALDHRGHGRSAGPRALIDRLDPALADIDTVVDLAAAEAAGGRPWLLGHSMGGCLALAYALRHQDKLAGLMLSAPLAALAAAPPPLRLAARVLSVVTPRLGVYSVDPELVSRDPAEVRAYREDPLVHHGKLPARTVAELTSAIQRFEADIPALELPLLVMHGTADALTPPDGSRMVDRRAGSGDKRLILYDGLYHELFNELREDRERVFADLTGWLAPRL